MTRSTLATVALLVAVSLQGASQSNAVKFDGTLGPARVIGRLIHATQLNPTPPARTIMLTASAKDADLMHGSATYGAWREKWEPIVKRRGPKW